MKKKYGKIKKRYLKTEDKCNNKDSIWYGMTKLEAERIFLYGRLPSKSAFNKSFTE